MIAASGPIVHRNCHPRTTLALPLFYVNLIWRSIPNACNDKNVEDMIKEGVMICAVVNSHR